MKNGTSNGRTRSNARAARSTVTRAIGLVGAGGAASATVCAIDREGTHATTRATREARAADAHRGPATDDARKMLDRCRAVWRLFHGPLWAYADSAEFRSAAATTLCNAPWHAETADRNRGRQQ